MDYTARTTPALAARGVPLHICGCADPTNNRVYISLGCKWDVSGMRRTAYGWIQAQRSLDSRLLRSNGTAKNLYPTGDAHYFKALIRTRRSIALQLE